MTYLIMLYLIGLISTYSLTKKLRNDSECNEWSDAFATIILSLLSWVGFIAVIVALISWTCRNTKPPKWL